MNWKKIKFSLLYPYSILDFLRILDIRRTKSKSTSELTISNKRFCIEIQWKNIPQNRVPGKSYINHYYYIYIIRI